MSTVERPSSSADHGGPWVPSGRCSLLACDIASFGSLAGNDYVQRHVRTALYDRLAESFDRSGVSFDGCYHEDRGDGAFVAIPPDVPTATIVAPLIDRLHIGLRRYNEVSKEIAQIRLRVALHTGEAHRDAHGVVGTAVNHVFRLLDATVLKESLDVSGACLAFIASDQVYNDVIRHAIDMIEPTEYRQVDIRVKETATRAWIRIPGPPAASAPDAARPDTQAMALIESEPPVNVSTKPEIEGRVVHRPPAGVLFSIVERMLDLPVMTTEKGREQVVGALRKEIATRIPRQAEAGADAFYILRTCLDYPGGLPELLTVLRGFAGTSVPMEALEEAITRLIPYAD